MIPARSTTLSESPSRGQLDPNARGSFDQAKFQSFFSNHCQNKSQSFFNHYLNRIRSFFSNHCQKDHSVTCEQAATLAKRGLEILTLEQTDEADLDSALQSLGITTIGGTVDPANVLPQISWAVQYLAAQNRAPYESGTAVIPTKEGSALTELFARMGRHSNAYMRDGSRSSHFQGMRGKSDNQEQHFGYDIEDRSGEKSLAFNKKHILFGTLKFHNKTDGVFVKIESHGIKGLQAFLLHTRDFILTNILHINQGQTDLVPRREDTPESDAEMFKWIMQRVQFEEMISRGQPLSLGDFADTEETQAINKNSSAYGYAYMHEKLHSVDFQNRICGLSKELQKAVTTLKTRMATLDHPEIRKGREFIVEAPMAERAQI